MILDDICAHKREEVAAQKKAVPIEELHERVAAARPTRPFRDALRAPGLSLIAEIKRASPVKGVFMEDMDPVGLAALYEQAGARALSVLTDSRYFKGSLADLINVRQGVTLPCLRKEFIVDEYQIHEARAANADAILLIVRILSDAQLNEYQALARSLGMAALVETHDFEELERAVNAQCHIIGVNNRDLDTFTVDVNTTLELRKHVPGGHVLVSESGIQTPQHMKRLEDGGVDAVLIGETLVTSSNIAETIRELLGCDSD